MSYRLSVECFCRLLAPHSFFCKQLIAWLLIVSTSVFAEDKVTLLGAELSPYAFQENDQITGLGVELLQEAAQRIGHSGEITLMPFKRAFQNAITRKNLLMTPVARVESREGLLKWAIHYLDDSFFYVTRAGSRKLTHGLAREGGLIGVLAGSAPLARLKAGGVTNYLEQTRDTANINMLRIGRIEGWFTSSILLNGAFKSHPELDPKEFVIGEEQSRHCVYIVASNDTSEEILQPWREVFNSMLNDGTYQQILSRYLDQDLQLMLGIGSDLPSGCGRY
ncbi:ABC transporter substrate-binding protein [Motiliproteus sp. MSK22-1]|uniref:substrate-binding periplasmic protein n=1 Tax=Motiliproteus sp. MSK22-1 TaxID=1897630 RepID=UPI0013010AC2|nr:ABC transporter substrate-binding protein [Motiliproteus sp. MSK22-1]